MEIDIGSIVINADSVPPTSFKIVDKFRASYYGDAVPIGSIAVTLSEAPRLTPLSTTVYQGPGSALQSVPNVVRTGPTPSDKMYNLESVEVMPEKMPFGVDTCIVDGEVWLEATLEAAADR